MFISDGRSIELGCPWVLSQVGILGRELKSRDLVSDVVARVKWHPILVRWDQMGTRVLYILFQRLVLGKANLELKYIRHDQSCRGVYFSRLL